MTRYKRFDRSRLEIKPLEEREHLLGLDIMLQPDECRATIPDPRYFDLASTILKARRQNAPVILMLGAHLLRSGASPLIIRLMEEGLVSHVAMNGAGPIHDYEFALIGATTESVAKYIRNGQFGLWKETGAINEIVAQGSALGLGYGESLGKYVEEHDFPNKDISILAASHRLGIPVTVHIGIGYDIIHEHPNCDAAALARASYEDFLIFTEAVAGLEGGVLLNFGSAVMGPEVYLKALAMARNAARREAREIKGFTTAVFDLLDLGEDLLDEPPRNDPRYYFRPYKTILVRTVRDGGSSHYFQGAHRETFATLFAALHSVKGETH